MADISAEIAAFQSAKYGEDVRDSMVSLAVKINDEVEDASDKVDQNTQDVESFSMDIGDVTTLPYTDQATAEITGEGFELFLNLGIPQGAPGGAAGDISQNAVNFSDASTRDNLVTGQTLATGFGKIKKWFTDLATGAFAIVANALDITDSGYVLDARQGKVLSDQIATKANSTDVASLVSGALQVQSLRIINASTTIAAGGHTSDTTVTPTAITGYTPILATPRNTGGDGMLNFYKLYMDSSHKVVFSLANPRTTAVTFSAAYVNVLYIKNDLA